MNAQLETGLAVAVILVVGRALLTGTSWALARRLAPPGSAVGPPAGFVARAEIPSLFRIVLPLSVFIALFGGKGGSFGDQLLFWGVRALPLFAVIMLLRAIEEIRASSAARRLSAGARPEAVALPPRSRILGATVAIVFVAAAVLAVVAVFGGAGDRDFDLDVGLVKEEVPGASFSYPEGWERERGYAVIGSDVGAGVDSLAGFQGPIDSPFAGTSISVSRTVGLTLGAVKRAMRAGPLADVIALGEEVVDERAITVPGADEAVLQRVVVRLRGGDAFEELRLLAAGGPGKGYIVIFSTWEGQLDDLEPLAQRIIESFRIEEDAI